MNDNVNVAIAREDYNRFSIIAAKRRKKEKRRVSIKEVIGEASKLIKV